LPVSLFLDDQRRATPTLERLADPERRREHVRPVDSGGQRRRSQAAPAVSGLVEETQVRGSRRGNWRPPDWWGPSPSSQPNDKGATADGRTNVGKEPGRPGDGGSGARISGWLHGFGFRKTHRRLASALRPKRLGGNAFGLLAALAHSVAISGQGKQKRFSPASVRRPKAAGDFRSYVVVVPPTLATPLQLLRATTVGWVWSRGRGERARTLPKIRPKLGPRRFRRGWPGHPSIVCRGGWVAALSAPLRDGGRLVGTPAHGE